MIQQSNYLCQISGNASNNISIPSTIPTTLNNVPPSQDMGYQQQGQLQQHQQLQLHQHQHHQQPQQPLQTHQAHQSHQSHQPHQPHQSHQPPPQSMLPLAQQIQNPSENQNIQSNVNSGGPISTHHSLTDLRSANKSIVNHNNINAGSIEVGNGKFRTVNSMSNLAGAQQATFDLA